MSVAVRTSSPKYSVSRTITSSVARTATRWGLVRSTNRPMPTRPVRSSVSRSSAYGRAPVRRGAR